MCLETIADENWLTEFFAKIDDIKTVRFFEGEFQDLHR